MKGREIRETLQGKVDPQVLHVLCELGESLSAQQQEIMELATLQNGIIDMVTALGVSIESATNSVDRIKRIRHGGEDGD